MVIFDIIIAVVSCRVSHLGITKIRELDIVKPHIIKIILPTKGDNFTMYLVINAGHYLTYYLRMSGHF